MVPPAINSGAPLPRIASQGGLTSTGVTWSTGTWRCIQSCVPRTPPATSGFADLPGQDLRLQWRHGMTVNGSIYWLATPTTTAEPPTPSRRPEHRMGRGQEQGGYPATVTANELDGKTFVPGVYHNGTLGMKIGGWPRSTPAAIRPRSSCSRWTARSSTRHHASAKQAPAGQQGPG